MTQVVRWLFSADGRSVTTTLDKIAQSSGKTRQQVKEDADKNAASFDKVGVSAKRLRETVGGLAGLVGFGGLAFGLKDAVQGGIQLQGAQAQLQASLKATGLATGDTNKQLREYGERLSTRGGFTTAENLSALTAFVRETHSASKAQQGLALATDIARGRNIDLSSAQMVVQRAYGGSIGKLQALLGPMVAVKNAQYGLTQAHKEQVLALEAQAKAMGKSGPAWLKQQEILQGITPQMRALAALQDKSATGSDVIAAAEKVFGGATGAYAGTTQGKVSNLQHSLQNLTDTTGEKLLPAVNMLAKDATVVVNLFGKLPVPLQATILGVGAIGLLLSPLAGGFRLLRDAAHGTSSLVRRLGGASEVAAPEVTRLGRAAAVAGAEASLGGDAALLGGRAKGVEGKGGGLLAKLLGKAPGGSKLLGLAEKIGLKGLPKLAGAVAIPAMVVGTLINHVPFLHGLAKHVPGLSAVSGILGFAGGGMTPYPGTFMVGERGPEMVNLPQGAHITPNNQLGPQNITLNVQLRMPNGRVLAEEVIKYSLNRAARGPTSLIGGSLVTGAPGLPA